MEFYIPTRVLEEDNCVINHAEDMAKFGKKALVVTGKSSAKKNGSFDDCVAALEKCGVSYHLFDEIEENPSVETVVKGRDIALDFGADFVIGIGGGSPLDASKAIAFLLKQHDESCLFTAGDSKTVPIVSIPTTCGTGSEATPYAILTRHEMRTKASISHRIFPTLSLVDAKYLKNAPKKLIRDTAMDAFGHLSESYVNVNSTDYSKMFVSAGLELWAKSRDVLLGKREAEIEDYKNMMNASTIAGMAISHTATSLPHGLSYTLTYELGMSHGRGVGYFQAGYLREAEKAQRDYVLSNAGFNSLDEFEEFYSLTCTNEKVDAACLEKAAEGILKNASRLKNCPYEVDEAKMRRICGLK